MSEFLPRLLEHLPPSMFDKAPAEQVALRVRNPAGLQWVVADEKLRLVTGAGLVPFDGGTEWNGHYDFGVTSREYALAGKTIAQLADEVQADGFEVVYENPDLGGLSALILIDGSGDQDASNGDHLNGFTSLLWSIMDLYASEVSAAAAQIPESIKQMVIKTAGDEFLDVLANLYGVPRLLGDRLKFDKSTTFDGSGTFDGNWDESDAHLRERLPREVLRHRVTPFAIEDAIKDATGQVVRIDEPWKKLFTVGVSSLSGDHRMHDGEYYTYHVIQAVGSEGADFAPVNPVILRNKPAGVQVYQARIDFPPWYVQMLRDDFVAPPVRTEFRGDYVNTFSNQLLGVMRLDAAEGEIINHKLAQHWWRFVAQTPVIEFDGLKDYDGELSYSGQAESAYYGLRLLQNFNKRREIAVAAVCLSDGVALGDENGVLSRGIDVLNMAPAMSLSGTGFLSAVDQVVHAERVERITLDPHASGAASDFTVSGVEGRVDSRSDSNVVTLYLTYDGNKPYDGSVAYQNPAFGSLATTVVLGLTDLTFDGAAIHDGTYQHYGTRGF